MREKMKRTLGLLMSIVMLVSVISVPMTVSAAGPTPLITVVSATGAVGDVVEVMLDISGAPYLVGSMTAALFFDQTVLEFVPYNAPAPDSYQYVEFTYVSAGSLIQVGNTVAGRLKIAYSNAYGFTGEGNFMHFKFRILPSLTSTPTPVTLNIIEVTDAESGDEYACTAVDGSVSLLAATTTYEITFDAAGGTGGDVLTVEEGEMPVAPVVTRDGYNFLGWDVEIVAATADATYTAQWEEILPTTYEITFDANGGTGGDVLTVEEGEMPVAPVVTRDGYTFLGWDVEVAVATADATYTAQWAINTYTITFDAAGGIGGDVQTVAHGATPVAPVVTRDGYTFLGWDVEVAVATADATYTAQWELIPVTTYYTITFDANGGIGGDVLTVEEGVLPVAPTVTYDGYTFLGWDVEVAVATADATYTAQWELIPVTTYYTITFDANGGIGGDVLTVEEGVLPVAPTVTYDGYTFLGWDVEVAVATADATYTAQWELIPVTTYYTITFDANGGIGGDVLTVEEGVLPVAPTVTYDGYTFLGWDVEVAVATADATYTAQWELIPVTTYYTITFDANGGIGGDVLTVEEGVLPVAPTVTYDGYTFLGWDVEVAVATADATYTAQWELIPVTTYYTITFDANGGIGGEVQTVEEGVLPVAPTVTYDGYTFLGWDVEVAVATADATYTAQWELIPVTTYYTITFDANGGIGGEVQTVEEGAMPTAPVVTRAGYTFLGWDVEIVAAEADATYTAQWEEVAETLLGDVNGDGEISVLDALMVLQSNTGAITLTPKQLEAADVNRDGRVSALDALMILHFISGRLPSFPSPVAG